ncbi:MAG: sugar nucleotide-binding protein [Bdellovibrionales bacterium]|nr:sugar nucleotide-binding protein [Bdellovibrionales bacterium]
MGALKKILIVGGSGFVGTHLAGLLSRKHSITSTFRGEFTAIPGVEYVYFNGIHDKDRCSSLVQKHQPDVVIFSAGSNDPAKAEKDPSQSQLVHLTGANQMLTAAEYLKAKYIYLSSDWVFSGIDGNFGESDTAIPSYALGKTKLGAENYIRNRSVNHIIIRCAPLLGRGTLDHPSWLDHLRDAAAFHKPISLSDRSIRNPVHVRELATLIDRVIEGDVRNKTLHLGGLTRISEYQLAVEIFETFGFDRKDLTMTKSGQENSNQDFSLNYSRTLKLLKTEPLLLKQSLDLLK